MLMPVAIHLEYPALRTAVTAVCWIAVDWSATKRHICKAPGKMALGSMRKFGLTQISHPFGQVPDTLRAVGTQCSRIDWSDCVQSVRINFQQT